MLGGYVSNGEAWFILIFLSAAVIFSFWLHDYFDNHA